MPKLLKLPALAPAEKSALAILLALLVSGAALRAWQRSGVSLGPVDDWETLRALVIRARAEDAAPWPCAHPAEAFGEAAGGAKKPARGGGKTSGGNRKQAPAGVVDLNKASEKQLNALPGVGPSTARAIVAWRAANGPFTAPEELMRVKGIGPRKFEALRAWVKAAGPRREPPAEAPGSPAASEGNGEKSASGARADPLPDTISRGSNAFPAPAR
jgi:competence ComEA-like helix-hairpin-helix protein